MSEASRERRDGREAFMPGVDPEEICPYKKGAWDYESRLDNFKAGWNAAEAIWGTEESEKVKAADELELMMETCPWRDNRLCKASGAWCNESNCAVLHIREAL